MTAATFDVFARWMRDKGWQGVDTMLASGIQKGDILELGPGPGYVGLELAKKLGVKSFTACEISPAMISLAESNAAWRHSMRHLAGNGNDSENNSCEKLWLMLY